MGILGANGDGMTDCPVCGGVGYLIPEDPTTSETRTQFLDILSIQSPKYAAVAESVLRWRDDDEQEDLLHWALYIVYDTGVGLVTNIIDLIESSAWENKPDSAKKAIRTVAATIVEKKHFWQMGITQQALSKIAGIMNSAVESKVGKKLATLNAVLKRLKAGRKKLKALISSELTKRN